MPAAIFGYQGGRQEPPWRLEIGEEFGLEWL